MRAQSNMGLPLSGIGRGPAGHEPLVSWDGSVSFGLAELNRTRNYELMRVTEQGAPPPIVRWGSLEWGNLNCSEYHGRQRCSRDTPMEDAMSGGWRQPSRENMGGFSAVCWMVRGALLLLAFDP